MTIRPMLAADLTSIKRIDRASFPAHEQYDGGMYDRMLESGLSLVALDDDKIVGYAFVQMNPLTHVRSLAVHPGYRRHGFGKALMAAVIRSGKRRVDLLVDEANLPAIRLYETLGFAGAEMCPTLPPKRRMVLDLQ